MRRALVLALGVLMVAEGAASADQAASRERYTNGRRAYAAGQFELALEEFVRAHQAWPAPEYLHDIAQALRRLGRCADALEHFERYLAEKPKAPNRAETERHIASLRRECPRPAATAPASPAPSVPTAPAPTSPPAPAVPTPAPIQPRFAASTAPTAPTAPGSGGGAPGQHPAAAGITRASAPRVVAITAPAARRTPWSASAGASVLVLDAGPVVMPAIAQLAIAAHRQTDLPLALRLGAGLSLARLPYDDLMSGTVWLGGPELIADGSLPIRGSVALIGALALGAQLAWGLGEGNPFIDGGRASDSFAMARLRADLGVAWRANDRVSVRVVPLGYQVSPRRAALADDIHALHGFATYAGINLDL